MENNVVIYSEGVVNISVCVPEGMLSSEIEAEVNRRSPPGGDLVWTISESETFLDGTPMPCFCNQTPSRKHWLLHC